MRTYQEREILFNNNKRLVPFVLSKMYLDKEMKKYRDDALQEGYLALWKATEGFDKTMNFEFNTYAARAIHNSIIRYLHKNSNHAYIRSFDAPIEDANEKNLTLHDVIGDKPEGNVEILIDDIIAEYTNYMKEHSGHTKSALKTKLDDIRRILNAMIFTNNFTTIGNELGISRMTVSKDVSRLRYILSKSRAFS